MTKLLIFCLGAISGLLFYEQINPAVIAMLLPGHKPLVAMTDSTNNVHYLEQTKIRVCFTPPSNCSRFVAEAIDQASNTIYMQAYGLTHPDIARALIKAEKRGVKVKILVDRSNLKSRNSKIHELQAAGIDVDIDWVAGIAHNKIIILDKRRTISGSFNFTVSASTKNAENVLIIDDTSIAESYLQNWQYRETQSQQPKWRKNHLAAAAKTFLAANVTYQHAHHRLGIN